MTKKKTPSVARKSKAKPKPKSKPKIERVAGGRWAKGQSGNPGGRVKGPTITPFLRVWAEVVQNPDAPVPITYAEAIAKKVMDLAVSGEIHFVRIVLDRIDGPVKQVIEDEGGITGADLKGKRIIIEQTIIRSSGELAKVRAGELAIVRPPPDAA